MRITTYEKGGNSLNPFIKLFIFLMIILCLFVIPVSADDWTWNKTLVSQYDMSLCYISNNLLCGDIDNDGIEECLAVGRDANQLVILELDGTNRVYDVQDPYLAYWTSLKDINNDGQNEVVYTYASMRNSNEAEVDLYQFNFTHINQSNTNNILGVSSDNPHGIGWMEIDSVWKFYSAYCGGGEVVHTGLNFTGFDYTQIDTVANSGESVVIFDIDQDGTDELVVSGGFSVGGATVYVYEINSATGEYTSKTTILTTSLDSSTHYSCYLTHGDIDNDGIENLIVLWEPHDYIVHDDGIIEAYEFSTSYASGYEEGFEIASTGTGFLESSDVRTYVVDVDGDGENELLTGQAGYLPDNRQVHLAYYDVGVDGSNIEKNVLHNFTDYFGSEYYTWAVPSMINDSGIMKVACMVLNETHSDFYIFEKETGETPEFNDVSWDYDPYYTGETAIITTNIVNFNDGIYSYYLDLYNTQKYLTTYQITSEIETNSYMFPTEWTDTTLLAKLQRVTDPYGSNEVNLAMDLSHFETLNWDTAVSFDKSSYNPRETLTVTWSGAPTGSTVWLRAMDDGEIIKPNVDYSGSFEFIVPSTTQETYYLVDVIVNGVSQAQASCIINIGDYWVDDYIYVSNYSFSDGDTYGFHNVDRAEYLNVTTETNINTDFVDVYYNNVYDDRMVSIDHIENLDGTDQILKFPNDLGFGQYITIIYYHNVTTGTQAELSYYTNVGEKSEGIDIYNAVITMDDTKEILDIESISGYGGNDLVVPSNRIVIFDIYADEIINSTIITEDYRYEGDANYNSTSNYHIKRSYLFDVLGLIELQFEVHNDATNTDDIIKYKVYVQGIDQTDLDGSVVMYWTKTKIELNEDVLLYFNVSDMPNNPILTIVSTGDSKYTTERTLYTNQTGTESIPDYYKEIGTYTATMTCNDIVYAISTLTIIDPDEDEVVIIKDITMSDNVNNLINSPYLIGLFIMCVFLAIGATNGIGGTIVTGSIGLGIVCYMGIFPWILLVIEVLVVAALMAKGMINLAGD
jgi:hypothetical protein